ncbi:MAG: CapA family protein [Clostridia bacterium]|nr:CapA family protein [Clostridia bacterium]
MRRLLCAALCLILVSGVALAEKTILLTFTGDCTLGGEESTRSWETSFDSVAAAKGWGCFFSAFTEMFAADDATIVNLEGVLADSTDGAKGIKNFRFRGDPAYVAMLKNASVEVASLANNHAMDYGEEGLQSTVNALKSAGIRWIRRGAYIVLKKDGVRVALFGVDADGFREEGKFLCSEISRVKFEDEVDAVIAVCHTGKEHVPKHYAVQANTATALIDAGADLVIMHHPHVVQGVAVYNGATICYSLGNFVFGGNTRIQSKTYYRNHPATNLYGLVVQAELHFTDEGKYIGQQVFLYPILTSGDLQTNDYQPRLAISEDAREVLECVQFDTAFTLPDYDEDTGCVTLPFVEALPDAD